MTNQSLRQCYGQRNGIISVISNHKPCTPVPESGAASCCANEEICMSNGFCQFFGPKDGGNKTGYYLGSCTDPSQESAACRNECGGWPWTDVIYQYQINSLVWSCCGQDAHNNTQCFPPSGPAFTEDAPAPYYLLPVASFDAGPTGLPLTPAQATATVSVMESANSGSEAVATSPAARSNATVDVSSLADSSSVSPGVVAAIVVGVFLALSWIAMVAWIMKQRKKHRGDTSKIPSPWTMRPMEQKGTSGDSQIRLHEISEAPDAQRFGELPAQIRPMELPVH